MTEVSSNEQTRNGTLVDSIEQERLKGLLNRRDESEESLEASGNDQHQKSPDLIDSDSIENADGMMMVNHLPQADLQDSEEQVEINDAGSQEKNTLIEDINSSLKISTNSLESHHKSPTSSITPSSVKSYRAAKFNSQHTPTTASLSDNTISKPATPTPIGLNEKMSPGLAKRVTPSVSNGEISLSTSPVAGESSGVASLTVKQNGGSVVGSASKSPTPVSAPMSSNSSSSSASSASAANQKIQSALERNIQKLNTLPGKSRNNIRIANLSKEDIELFTQSVDQQQQYYQHAYSFACDSLQSTPEHHSKLNNQTHQVDPATNSQIYQQYLLDEQGLNESSNEYYLENSQGLNVVSNTGSLIQPYYIQGDLNRTPVGKIKSLRNNVLNAEREMTPDSIDENLVEVVNNTKKMTIANQNSNRRVQHPQPAAAKNLLIQKQKLAAPVPVKKQQLNHHQSTNNRGQHPQNRLNNSHSTSSISTGPSLQQIPLKTPSSLVTHNVSGPRSSNKSNMPISKSYMQPTRQSHASQAVASKPVLPQKQKQLPINKIQSKQNPPQQPQQQHIIDHSTLQHPNTAINRNGASKAAINRTVIPAASYEDEYYDENEYEPEYEPNQDHGELIEEEIEYDEEVEPNCFEQDDQAEYEDSVNNEYYEEDENQEEESQPNEDDNYTGQGYEEEDADHNASTTFAGQQFVDTHERGGDLTKSFIQRNLKKAYQIPSRQQYQEMYAQQLPCRSIQEDNSFIYSNANSKSANGGATKAPMAKSKPVNSKNPTPKYQVEGEKRPRQSIPKSNTVSNSNQFELENGGKTRLKSSSSTHSGQNIESGQPNRRRSFNQKNGEAVLASKIIDETVDETSDPAQITIEQQYDTDEETNKLLDNSLTENVSSADDEHHQSHANGSQGEPGQSKSKEMNLHKIIDPETQVLIEGVLFRAKYLGSTQLISDGNPTKLTRMLQAQEAVGRIKAPEGESQPSVEVDLFVSTEKIMVLNTNLQEIMMDHSLRSISYIADIGNLVVLMAKRRTVANSDEQIVNPLNKRQVKMICHVFESEEAQIVAQSIGQAFQVAYMEYLKANGIEDMSIMKDLDYQEVLNQQEIMGNELLMFAKKECQKEVIVPKLKNEILGLVIVESGWGSMLPTVVVANIMPTGPAARCSNLNIGDQIISVNGISLVGLNLAACQAQIKSTKHLTLVRLVVVPCPPVVEVLIKRPDTKYQLGFSVQDGIICSLLRGGIAERGGVRVGHRIIEINNQSVVAVNHEKIVSMLANSVGELRMKTMPTQMFRLLTGQEAPIYI